MKMDKRLQQHRGEILRIAARYGAKNVRIFGSAVRGDQGPESDVDFLVDMEEGRSYLDLVGFWQELEQHLGCQVDVITDGGISPYLRDQIYAEAVSL